MHPIFFTWNGTYDELCAMHENGTFFHTGSLGTRTVHLDDADPHTKYFGVVEASSPSHRKHLVDFHPNLTILPGPHGTLTQKHADAINEVLPALKVKEGDSLEPTLLHVHGLFGDHEFHPHNY